MIAAYESPARPCPAPLDAPKSYGLGLDHKHLPEMQAVSGLTRPPLFVPVVCDYYSGMQVLLPLDLDWLAPAPRPWPRAWRRITRVRQPYLSTA